MAVTSSSYVSEDATSIDWTYEQIVVLVSEAGIQRVDWDCPVTLKEVVADNVSILSFDDARAVFEELTPLIYEGKAEEGSDGGRMTAAGVKGCLCLPGCFTARKPAILITMIPKRRM